MSGDKLIATVGHILVDIRLKVDRFPKPDEEAEILEERVGVGGSAANVAIALRRLGLRSSLIAKIGLDSFGRIAVDHLLKYKVDISGLKVSINTSTGFSIVVIDGNGNIVLYSYKGASETLSENEISQDIISRANMIHIASIRPEIVSKVLNMVKEGKLVSWDPGRVISRMGIERLGNLISKVDILLANREEAEEMAHESDPERAARKLHDLGAKLVIVKLGAEGSLAVGNFGKIRIPRCPVEKVVDTTGAGDSFAAGLLAAIAKGYNVEDSLAIASAAASLKVMHLGSHEVPSFDEVVDYARRKGCL